MTLDTGFPLRPCMKSVKWFQLSQARAVERKRRNISRSVWCLNSGYQKASSPSCSWVTDLPSLFPVSEPFYTKWQCPHSGRKWGRGQSDSRLRRCPWLHLWVCWQDRFPGTPSHTVWSGHRLEVVTKHLDVTSLHFCALVLHSMQGWCPDGLDVVVSGVSSPM